MNDVGNKLIGQFADCLATTITEGGTASEGEVPGAGAAAGESRAASGGGPGAQEGAQQTRPTPESIDLLDVAGGSLAKRLAPVAALVLVIVVVWAVVRRRRR
jgi:hypothetical protein